MSKRRSNSKEEKWLRKLKKYEEKLSTTRRNRRIIYSSDDDVHVSSVEDSSEVQLPYEEVQSQVTEPPAADTLLEENLLRTPLIQTPDAPEAVVDEDLLQTLGDFEPDVVEWGDDLLDDVAKRFQHILLNGLKKDTKEALHKRHLCPKNAPLTKSPTLNPELSSIISDSYRNRDKTIANKQLQLGKALTALGRAMSALILRSTDIQGVMRHLNDCSQLIADSHYNETYTRRSLLIPTVDKSLTDSLKDRKRDEFLFGKDLSEMVKNSRGIKKTGNLMQGTAPSKTLNWKGPPLRTRPTRNFNLQTNQAGGQRSQQYTRSRRFPPPPAPQRRTTQPPQPPPARRQPVQPSSSRRSQAQTDRDRLIQL